jgi:cation/acetate symporter
MAEGARAARSSAVWGLLFAALLITVAPALAAYSKLALLKLVAAHTEIGQLPDWVFTYGRLGLVDLCGAPAIDKAVVVKACAALPDASTVVRLQDLALSPDMITLAVPEITGLGSPLLWLVAAAALAVALVTAEGPLAAIVGAFGWESQDQGALGARAIAVGVIAVTGLAAATHPAPIIEVATWAFTIAAAGLFPALVFGLWWRRASAPAAMAAMLTGLVVCLHYLLSTRYLAVGFFETWQALSSAGPTARETFGELKNAWVDAAPGAAKDAAWAALDAHAQGIANWWGIKSLATVLLAVPAGALVMVLVSLAAPRRQTPETAS